MGPATTDEASDTFPDVRVCPSIHTLTTAS